MKKQRRGETTVISASRGLRSMKEKTGNRALDELDGRDDDFHPFTTITKKDSLPLMCCSKAKSGWQYLRPYSIRRDHPFGRGTLYLSSKGGRLNQRPPKGEKSILRIRLDTDSVNRSRRFMRPLTALPHPEAVIRGGRKKKKEKMKSY